MPGEISSQSDRRTAPCVESGLHNENYFEPCGAAMKKLLWREWV